MSQINRREKECVQGQHKSRCVSCLNILTRADLGKNKLTKTKPKEKIRVEIKI